MTTTEPICPRCGRLMIRGWDHINCQDRADTLRAQLAERVRKLEAVAKTARHFYGHYGPLNDALDRLDALDKPEVQE